MRIKKNVETVCPNLTVYEIWADFFREVIHSYIKGNKKVSDFDKTTIVVLVMRMMKSVGTNQPSPTFLEI